MEQSNSIAGIAIQHVEPLTDLGNAKRLVRIAKGRIAFIRETKRWFVWNGFRWEEDTLNLMPFIEELLMELKAEEGVIQQALNSEVKSITQVDNSIDPNDFKSLIKNYPSVKKLNELRGESSSWYKQTQMEYRLRAIRNIAQGFPELTKSLLEFDSKGKFIGTKNGVLNIETGKFVTNEPDYLITKFVNADYEQSAGCPNWVRDMETYMLGDKEQVKLLQKIAGVALSGEEKDKIFFFVGGGDNGKSTFQKTLQRLLNTYATVTDARVITGEDAKQEYYKADMIGMRMITISETREEAYLAGALVKECLESGKMSGRFPAGRKFDFQPIFTGIVSTNWLPNIGDDPAVWKRIVTMKWDYIIPADKRDKNYIDKHFMPELNGILNWALEGYRLYRQEGWNLPETLKVQNVEEMTNQDKLQTFLDSVCTVANGREVEGIAFRNIYKQWCDSNGFKAEGSKTLNEKLRKKGFIIEKVRRQMTIKGLWFGREISRTQAYQLLLDEIEDKENRSELLVKPKEKVTSLFG